MKNKKHRKNMGEGTKPTVIINIKNLHVHMDERKTSTNLILPDETEDCGHYDECEMCDQCDECEYEDEEE